MPQVALVGYTNAGKSTLLNAMVDAYVKDEDKRVFEEDMLFATLETAVRRIENERKKPFFWRIRWGSSINCRMDS